MDIINYTLKGQEPSTKTKSKGLPMNALVVIGLIGFALFALSFVFGEGNALAGSRFSLFLLGMTFLNLGIGTAGKKTREPFEIQFYPEYLTVFRERHHFDGMNPRMQFEKFYYKNMRACIWDRTQKKLVFIGPAEITATEYDSDGNLQMDSHYQQLAEHTCVISTEYSLKTDYKMEIERNAPIRVDVR